PVPAPCCPACCRRRRTPRSPPIAPARSNGASTSTAGPPWCWCAARAGVAPLPAAAPAPRLAPMSAARFQSFEDSGERGASAPRVAALRAELARRGLDGFVVPRTDRFQNEYVPPCAERLAWLT